MKIHQLTALIMSLAFISPSFANDYNLGVYQLNRGEFKAAIAEFQPLVDDNYAPAQYQLAQIYLNGHGTNKNPEKAVELLTLAAKQNYADALFSLSVIYSEGKVAKQDLTQAFELMRKAALKELPSAQFNLAVMYAEGQGTKKDEYQASRWYKKAANQNYALAQFNLALMYYEGKGLEQSNYWSYVWNTIAAKGGYKDAQKSRDLDARKLSVEQLKIAQEEANTIRQKLIRKQDLEAKQAAEAVRFN